jgi:hypothetical protein
MILRAQTKTVVLVHRLAGGSATATLAMAAAAAAASGFLSTNRHLARLIFLSRAVCEMCSKLHRLAGRYDNLMSTWFLSPIVELELPSRDPDPDLNPEM